MVDRMSLEKFFVIKHHTSDADSNHSIEVEPCPAGILIRQVYNRSAVLIYNSQIELLIEALRALSPPPSQIASESVSKNILRDSLYNSGGYPPVTDLPKIKIGGEEL